MAIRSVLRVVFSPGLLLTLLVVLGRTDAPVVAAQADEAARRGYRHLVSTPYLPPDFDEQTFSQVWRVWPQPLRGQAARATPAKRRAMAMRRYGLTLRPQESPWYAPSDAGKPLQYVVDSQGNWTMNCFACHGGQVDGRVVLGAPNNRFALETLTADIRQTKLRLNKPLARMDVGSLVMPLGTTNGTTNAVMFGVALMASRDAQLNVRRRLLPPPMVHHDMDAPAWWNFRRKRFLYIDGFAPRGHRALMQFMLVEENGPDDFRQWEDDFRDVQQFLPSLRPPRFPGSVDRPVAERGREVFETHCSQCHGTYGQDRQYPEVRVPLREIATDPVRLTALTAENRKDYALSWFARENGDRVVLQPDGYVAPPLDGVWASAPYLHNGSVPTLWHVLHPRERPIVWRRTDDGEDYDRMRVGLPHTSYTQLPRTVRRADERRQYFDTRRFGKSNAGHDYPSDLTERERRAVLEYLKTL